MVSHDLLRSTVTNQIAFDQRDSKSISNFERAIDSITSEGGEGGGGGGERKATLWSAHESLDARPGKPYRIFDSEFL